jgi:hypothetical protein
MGSRLELQTILENILESRNVYFQPPETVKLVYPCIIYSRQDAKTSFADDIPYKNQKQYKLMVIDKNPDSVIPDKIAQLPMCVFNQHYTKDNLNHDVYNIYY